MKGNVDQPPCFRNSMTAVVLLMDVYLRREMSTDEILVTSTRHRVGVRVDGYEFHRETRVFPDQAEEKGASPAMIQCPTAPDPAYLLHCRFHFLPDPVISPGTFFTTVQAAKSSRAFRDAALPSDGCATLRCNWPAFTVCPDSHAVGAGDVSFTCYPSSGWSIHI